MRHARLALLALLFVVLLSVFLRSAGERRSRRVKHPPSALLPPTPPLPPATPPTQLLPPSTPPLPVGPVPPPTPPTQFLPPPLSQGPTPTEVSIMARQEPTRGMDLAAAPTTQEELLLQQHEALVAGRNDGKERDTGWMSLLNK